MLFHGKKGKKVKHLYLNEYKQMILTEKGEVRCRMTNEFDERFSEGFSNT